MERKGRGQNQKMKNERRTNESIASEWMVSCILVSKSLPKMAFSINWTHWPPIVLCTPNQTHAITTRLMTGHKEPQIPKEDLHETGNEI